jgi:hypothetical protein
MSDVKWTGGVEHWTHRKVKEGEIKLFLWEKKASTKVPHAGTIFFVHGSSMASQPTFDLSVPNRPWSSAMDWFANHGFDTWTMDNEGYGRSDKHRDINFDISNGADDLAAGSEYIMKQSGAKSLLMYGTEGCAVHRAPSRARRQTGPRCLCLDRRRQPHAGAAQEKIARVFGQKPPADRPRICAQHLSARPSRYGGASGRRGVCRCDPDAG